MATVTDDKTSNEADDSAEQSSGRPVVAEHYEIDLEAPLGSGGMAVVYRGRDLRTRRDVALKTLRLEYRRDPESRARFRKEARTMAFLAHPNVTRVYDLWEDDEAPWAILEYVPGRTLKDEIAVRGPFTVEETAKLLDQMAKALDHLHQRGHVHLDVKPQNLLITPERTIKLIDFGLAQRAGEPQEMIGGSAFGTAAYLSPEQACGDAVDFSTDVYSLGCVVYEMLTGQPPFGHDGPGEVKNVIIRSHLERRPDPPSTIRPLAPWVDDAVLNALAKRPKDRYRDCASFARVFWTGIDVPDGVVGPTVRLWAPPVVDTHEVVPDPVRAPSRSVGSGIYRTGGRAARHTGSLRRLLWRATIALFVGNLLLAGLLYIDRGEIPGLVDHQSVLAAGSDARTTTDRLRIRAEPGRGAAVIAELDHGQRLQVTGNAVRADGETWWPMSVTLDGEQIDGYVSGAWIESIGGPGSVWIDQLVDEARSWPGEIVGRFES